MCVKNCCTRTPVPWSLPTQFFTFNMAFSMTPSVSQFAIAKKCGIHVKTFSREFSRLNGMNIAHESVLSVLRRRHEEESNLECASILTECASYRRCDDPVRNAQETAAERILARGPSRATMAPWELAAVRFENGRAKVMERARKKGAYPSDNMITKYKITKDECYWMATEVRNDYDSDEEDDGEIEEFKDCVEYPYTNYSWDFEDVMERIGM